ncbi:HupE/UreJ family protein [Flavobacterium sp. RHBU_24]|uniref:HupE/UreJ family protein n=1 Tax=Flavobacterium sp. RHBU_24 TaxID=3391185 RepID=UPI00398472C5
MTDFQLYFLSGLWHVISLDGLDHILFLAMLALPYTFKEWRQVLLLATLFTIGHTMTLVLAVYVFGHINSEPVEFFISLTIFITALLNIAKPGKGPANNINFIAVLALLFGIVHGLGFGKDFRMLVAGNTGNSFSTLAAFTLGLEAAQLIVVLCVLLSGLIVTNVLKVNRRDWLLVVSSFVAGISVTHIIRHRFW